MGTHEGPVEPEQLDRTTCLSLLATRHVGRLVLGGREPSVIPMNYRYIDGVVVLRTEVGSAADHHAGKPVSFEVDLLDDRNQAGWSVVVHGRLLWWPGDRAPPQLESWAPGRRDRWLMLGVDEVTGRMLRGRVDAEPAAHDGYL